MQAKRTLTFFNDKNYHAFTALEKAHFISYAPYAFQASVLLRDYDILKNLMDHTDGLNLKTIHSSTTISEYGVRILLEAGIGIGLLYEENGIYFITKTGVMFITDAMVRVNTNFMRDICYEGAGKLKESIETGQPKGLPYLGDWNTIYEGLSKLNPLQTKSWFEFDHYYSDYVFPLVMPNVFESNPKKILDIGANTGKFTIQCLSHNASVEIYLLDLGGQLKMAEKNINEAGFNSRYNLIEHNILINDNPIPGQYDIIWMSQFLDCFSDDEIVNILLKCKAALAPNGKIMINETFWDKQPFHSSMFSLQMTSLYFTTMANGNSQMYDSRVFEQLIKRAGLKLDKIEHQIATTHSLMTVII
jgi:2-polyprenyl-3-methyl-5-hydroxy-6-metoxy-1,4-benzoquinol methylase